MTRRAEAARGCAAVDVVEDLADEVGIGDICNHAKTAAAEWAECDIDFKDALGSTFGVRLEIPNRDLALPAGLRGNVEFVLSGAFAAASAGA